MDKDFELLWEEIHKKDSDKPYTDVNRVIGDAFRKYRKENGYSIKEFAEITDMNASTLSNIENGHWNLTTKRLQNIVDATHCRLIFQLVSPPKQEKETTVAEESTKEEGKPNPFAVDSDE